AAARAHVRAAGRDHGGPRDRQRQRGAGGTVDVAGAGRERRPHLRYRAGHRDGPAEPDRRDGTQDGRGAGVRDGCGKLRACLTGERGAVGSVRGRRNGHRLAVTNSSKVTAASASATTSPTSTRTGPSVVQPRAASTTVSSVPRSTRWRGVPPRSISAAGVVRGSPCASSPARNRGNRTMPMYIASVVPGRASASK